MKKYSVDNNNIVYFVTDDEQKAMKSAQISSAVDPSNVYDEKMNIIATFWHGERIK